MNVLFPSFLSFYTIALEWAPLSEKRRKPERVSESERADKSPVPSLSRSSITAGYIKEKEKIVFSLSPRRRWSQL
jgi:hypothetical protein